MPKKTKINVEENEVREIPQTPRKQPDEKVKDNIKEMKSPSNKSKIDTVEIPVDFIRNIRNIIYATSERVQWKTEELFPVGLVVRQLDQLIGNIDKDISDN
tara:strand:+ start:147 stop:449 length:303 start_codon:yes stop_codon:yes gene_type:complete